MTKKPIHTAHLHILIAPELIELLKATGEPSAYVRELIMNSFNTDDKQIRQARGQV